MQEWRHAHGMRCLGIPNTSHFYNVTSINDAIACKIIIFSLISDIVHIAVVWEKIKSTKNEDRWLADREVEKYNVKRRYIVILFRRSMKTQLAMLLIRKLMKI